jgi:hypothetical protein
MVSIFSLVVCLLLIEGTFAGFNVYQILLLQEKDNFSYIQYSNSVQCTRSVPFCDRFRLAR